MEPVFLTRSQVLALLTISESTLKRLIHDGEIPRGIRAGRMCRRWKKSDIENFLARREAENA